MDITTNSDYALKEFYLGSRKFQFVADAVGLPIDQVNFILAQVLALLFAYFFRVFLHPNNVSSASRHWTALSAGLCISYFCFGKSKPSALEYFGYLMNFQSILAGPFFMFTDYHDYIEGTHYIRCESYKKQRLSSITEISCNNNKLTELATSTETASGKMGFHNELKSEPCSTRAAMHKTFFAFVCALIVVFIMPNFPIKYLAVWNKFKRSFGFVEHRNDEMVKVRRYVRPHILKCGSGVKALYDFLTFIATRLCLSYMVFPFVLLRFWSSIHVYNCLRYYLHVLGLLAIFILPLASPVKERQKGGSKTPETKPINGINSNILKESFESKKIVEEISHKKTD
ncbi:Membrane-bound O-acyltransferase domain-containing protein 2 [Armadillidium vulgare]|nr:Membrane-bound O-acyltransferase domain-containing protein 2 [Armadillidium vulgare]